MGTIQRLVLKNFKRFKTLELEFDPELNILVGGNEAGKSSVLQALDIVLSAIRSKVEAIGIETLFNADCIGEFLRDNDHDYVTNCDANYADYVSGSIRIFADPDNTRHTFEVCMYQDNTATCEKIFSAGRKRLSVEDYMLKNKTDAAFALLTREGAALVAPEYIQQAVAWIRA